MLTLNECMEQGVCHTTAVMTTRCVYMCVSGGVRLVLNIHTVCLCAQPGVSGKRGRVLNPVWHVHKRGFWALEKTRMKVREGNMQKTREIFLNAIFLIDQKLKLLKNLGWWLIVMRSRENQRQCFDSWLMGLEGVHLLYSNISSRRTCPVHILT